MIITLNLIILCVLILLLFTEEVRHRRFVHHVKERRQELCREANTITPSLTNLKKYSELLCSDEIGTLSIAQQEVVGKMDASITQVMILLNRFLASSNLQKNTVEQEEINLIKVINDVANSMDTLRREKEHTLEITTQEQVLPIQAGMLQLHGIFDEVLLNALAYTDPGGTIEITVQKKAKQAIVQIRDTGIGISKEEQKHLFEKFFRGKKARKMYSQGNGMGLHFAKCFVEDIQGEIDIESKAGKGTICTIKLPIVK